MTVQLYDCAEEGIAREEEMLAKPGGRAALLWRCRRRALVVPRSWRSRRGFEAAHGRALRSGWRVAFRPSGGSAVPQGPGVLNFALISSCAPDFGIEDGYGLLCGAIVRAFEAASGAVAKAAIGSASASFCDGAWNVLVDGRKLAGTAQRRARIQGETRLLAHAAILERAPDEAALTALRALHADLGAPIEAAGSAHVGLDRLLRGESSAFPFRLASEAEAALSTTARALAA